MLIDSPSVSAATFLTAPDPSNSSEGNPSAAANQVGPAMKWAATPTQPAIDNTKFAKFVVGNTHHFISKDKATLDQTGKHDKVHDWAVLLNVLNGDEGKDAIACVNLKMSVGHGHVAEFMHS